MKKDKDFKAILSPKLSKQNDSRYIIVDDKNNILDDSNGNGYTSKYKAYRGYSYKQKNKENIRKKAIENSNREQAIKNEIKRFLKENPEVERDIFNLEFQYKSMGYDLDEQDLKEILEGNLLSFNKLFFDSKQLLDYLSK
ncbi:hypothetical protein CPT_Madawaska_217 [Staphylococcus phage Madawaska]|nr:hypothetical protein CPT_Madawaska_217 [Staphylococcus phage Madawaska]